MSMPLPPAVQKGLDATKVEYVRLGSSGLRVSAPILGAMSFGSKRWAPWVIEEAEAFEVLKAAYDRGINTWDTADMYSNGISEEILGKAIKHFNIPRKNLVLMTKCYSYIGEEPDVHAVAFMDQAAKSKDFVNQGGLSRTAIFKAVDASLARLDTDYIDLFQIHRFDPDTPIEETMEALHDLVRAGKLRYIGASSMWATQFARMQFTAEKHGWTKFVSMQNLYNLLYREEEREMIRFCNDTGVGLIAWSPLFGGKLARPLGESTSVRGQTRGPQSVDLSDTDEEIIRRTEALAKKKGWTMSQTGLAWLRSKGVVPITGLSSVSRVEDACGLRGKFLTEDESKQLEEPYKPKEIMGHF